MANIKDVARRAGVGVSTASRVLRGEGYTSADVRERVQRAAQDLHYLPNLLAQSMRGRPTRTIGFLVYDIVNPFFANLAAGIEDAAHARGFNVVICSSHPWKSSGREQSYMQMLLQRQIDGLVLQHVFSTSDYATLLERRGIPAARVLNPQPGYPYDLVRCDTKRATCELIRHLVTLGCPLHPYTEMLIRSLPRLGDNAERAGISGRPPSLLNPPRGCRFAVRSSRRW